MFHVEHRRGAGSVTQGVRHLDARDQGLFAALAQPFKNPHLVISIKLGTQVVQGDHGPLAADVGM